MTLLNRVFYILAKEQTVWEKIKEEIKETFEMFVDFFVMIKEVTYDPMVDKIGNNATNILLVMITALILMLVLSKAIQR